MDGLLLHEALAAAWRLVARANEYVDRQAPWKLAKDETRTSELHETLAGLAWMLTNLALMLEPFMPTKAQELWRQLGGAGNVDEQRWPAAVEAPADALDPGGWRVEKRLGLFPRETAPA
jgi:methionyl-tRNA synthetase